MNKTILSVMMLLLLIGCAVGPDYRRPAIDTPTVWRVEEKEAGDLRGQSRDSGCHVSW